MKRKDQEYEVKIQKLLEKEKAGSKGNSRQGSTKSSAGTNAQKGVALEDVKVDSRPSTAHDVKEEEVWTKCERNSKAWKNSKKPTKLMRRY